MSIASGWKGRERDPQYLVDLHKLPCAVWEFRGRIWVAVGPCDGAIEAAHVGWRPKGRKCDDLEAIPCCAGHHRTGRVSLHNGKLSLLMGRERFKGLLGAMINWSQAQVRTYRAQWAVLEEKGIPF